MSHHENLKIIAFVGLPGSGKTTAVANLARHGFPKIARTDDVINEIQHLLAAGQHKIAIDDLDSVEELLSIKRTFPGEITTICLIAPRHVRHHRLSKNLENQAELDSDDWKKAESSAAAPMVLANYSVINDGTIEMLNDSIHKIISTL